MTRTWRRLLAPCLTCAACAVYDPSLLSSGAGGTAGSGSAGIAGTAGGTGTVAGSAGRTGGSGTGAEGGSGAGTSSGGQGQGGNHAAGAGAGGQGEGGDPGSGGTGSVSGSTGLAGSTGGGGEPAVVLDLIDDFETPDVFGPPLQGRKPLWYLMDDGTDGTQEPSPFLMTELPESEQGAGGDSLSALFMSTTGFTGWGSGVGVDLLNAAGKQSYDLTPYVGISFWGKIPGTYRWVRINVPDIGTDPSGMICEGEDCNDHFGTDIRLSTEWERHEVLFEDMLQGNWGLPRAALDLEHVYSIHFQIAEDAELWIDDLSLIVK